MTGILIRRNVDTDQREEDHVITESGASSYNENNKRWQLGLNRQMILLFRAFIFVAEASICPTSADCEGIHFRLY